LVKNSIQCGLLIDRKIEYNGVCETLLGGIKACRSAEFLTPNHHSCYQGASECVIEDVITERIPGKCVKLGEMKMCYAKGTMGLSEDC
jgi:hypothetical protein